MYPIVIKNCMPEHLRILSDEGFKWKYDNTDTNSIIVEVSEVDMERFCKLYYSRIAI